MADARFTSRALNTPLEQLSAPVNLVPNLINGTPVSYLTGNFTYRMTAFNGGETTASTGVDIFGTGVAVSVGCDVVNGATNYRLYRSGVGYTGFALVSQGSELPIVDLAQISGDNIPSENSTAFKSRSMSTSLTTFYTCSGTGILNRTLVKEALVSNCGAATNTFDIHFVPSGETPSVGNASFYQISLGQNDTKILSINTVMEQGDTIQAKSSSLGEVVGYGAVNLKISGIELINV